MEYEEDRPRGRINDGRRHWREEGETGDVRDALDTFVETSPQRERGGFGNGGGGSRSGGMRPSRGSSASRDPFFEKPYEAPQREAEPAWEASAKAAPASRGISANIKPRRKVAALFKAAAPQPVAAQAPAPQVTETDTQSN
jgi:hypothetical protein